MATSLLHAFAGLYAGPNMPDPWASCPHEREANEAPACPWCGETTEEESEGPCEACRVMSEDEVSPI